MAPGPEPTHLSSPTTTIINKTTLVKCPIAGGKDGGTMPLQGSSLLPLYLSSNSRNSISITNTKGLLNMPGQNNCFLNSAVQVLWHLDIFRRSFRELNGHTCMSESCIFCALKDLFAQFQYSQESALPPDTLRKALAETFCDQRRFQLGFMDDAAECFENILLRIHFHIANKESEDMCSANHCIPHQKFAMTLVEQTVCHACGATSEPLPFTQMVHYVPSSALCSQAKVLRCSKDKMLDFGELLKRAGGLGDVRDCPSSCGTVIQIRKTLMNKPEIVSIGLVWDSERPSIDHIMDVFGTIGMTLKLQDVFHSVVDSRWASSATHHLVGIVTYYGKHYSTFFFHTKLRVWIYFDDAAVREIGPKWEQVVEKCYRGHFQPLLLLYANPHGSSISTSTAPHNITLLPEQKQLYKGKDECSTKLKDKLSPNHHRLFENQRRAMTPNPEASCDINANLQPRRAVTPSVELCYALDTIGKHPYFVNEQISNRTLMHETLLNRKNVEVGQNDVNWSTYKHDAIQNVCTSDIQESPGSKTDLSTKTQCTENECWPFLSYSPLLKCHSLSNSSITTEVTNEGSDAHPLVIIPETMSSNSFRTPDHCKLTNQMSSSDETCITEGVCDDDINSDKSYISRKAVENVLHLQNLQRQKSVNANQNHVCVAQRNSNSSLESLDNTYLVQDKSSNNFLGFKLDLHETINGVRKRDSGNWSGDRNSASSSSTTSLDNPYFYCIGNKKSHNGRIRSSSVPDSTTSTDLGYDSFSLSSSDSYPPVMAFSSTKSDPRLGQILENQQCAFVQNMPQLQNTSQPSKCDENIYNKHGFREECDKLCIEADIFLAKSVERENIGDISMAILLTDNAAAKARAALNVPYNNPQALSKAKLKHSSCIIRSSTLHKKFRDAIIRQQHEKDQTFQKLEVDEIQKGKMFTPSLLKDISRSYTSQKGPESLGKTDKSIEIYATLPKKNLKKKNGLISFVESLTGEDSASEKNFRCVQVQKINPDDRNSGNVPQKSENKNVAIPPGKRRPSIFLKFPGKDVESSAATEWENNQKNSLYRTNSSPPSNGKTHSSSDQSEESQLGSASFPKKQHKIRRKLMGGFMRRKNRSLPDLREGQDQENSLSRSFDDCSLQSSCPIKNVNEEIVRDNHSAPVQTPAAAKMSTISVETSNVTTDSVNLSQDIPQEVKTTQSFITTNHPKSQVQISCTRIPLPNKQSTAVATTAADYDTYYKRLSMNVKEVLNKGVTSDTGHSNISENELVTKLRPIGIKSVKSNVDPAYIASNQSCSKDVNNQELPKGSAIWLKELQLKQGEIHQKKKLEAERLKQQRQRMGSIPSNMALLSKDQLKLDGSGIEVCPAYFFKRNRCTNSKMYAGSDNESTTSSVQSVLGDNEESTSVKHLALKFEKINRLPPDIHEPSTVVATGINHYFQLPGNCGNRINSLDPKHTAVCNEKIISNTLSKKLCHMNPHSLEKDKDCSLKFSPRPVIPSFQVKDGHPKNVPNSTGNFSSLRNLGTKALINKEFVYLNLNKDKSVCTEIKRPDKPPDYETAIQRLEFLRGDKNFLKHLDISYISDLDSCTFENDKRKRGSKKSVTFSDKVVLVACAGDEENEFLPNPLLERVYKQHFMQKPESNSKDNSQKSQCLSDDNIWFPVDSLKQNVFENSKNSCNLCHSKLVPFPSVYCPDCAFYMSRFQK